MVGAGSVLDLLLEAEPRCPVVTSTDKRITITIIRRRIHFILIIFLLVIIVSPKK